MQQTKETITDRRQLSTQKPYELLSYLIIPSKLDGNPPGPRLKILLADSFYFTRILLPVSHSRISFTLTFTMSYIQDKHLLGAVFSGFQCGASGNPVQWFRLSAQPSIMGSLAGISSRVAFAFWGWRLYPLTASSSVGSWTEGSAAASASLNRFICSMVSCWLATSWRKDLIVSF